MTTLKLRDTLAAVTARERRLVNVAADLASTAGSAGWKLVRPIGPHFQSVIALLHCSRLVDLAEYRRPERRHYTSKRVATGVRLSAEEDEASSKAERERKGKLI